MSDLRELIRDRSFAQIWGASVVSGLGDKIAIIALYLLIFRLTGRAIDLGQKTRYVFFQGRNEFVSSADDARFSLVVGSAEFVERELDRRTDTPRTTALQQNYPNPFNPSTIIRYELARAGNVELKVYDVSGALVKTLESTYRVPGRYEVGWDGDNEAGQNVSSGIYFYRLATPWTTQTRKMTLIK